MSEIKDGGPAFPGQQDYTPQGWNQTWDSGMTLRDWFAGQAMIGLAADNYDRTDQSTALRAYDIADAMIKAREAKP